ncbi:MAG: alpha/beta hydrolase [Alphaproteobacteria bacterium]|nr:MAG: alpha/beta hydrolase [Alphaproteobacteria bacterium]
MIFRTLSNPNDSPLPDVATMQRGLSRYCAASYQREKTDYPLLWRKGNVSLYQICTPSSPLLDPHAPLILCIPSLINRNYILDLSEHLSLMRYLAQQGYRVCMVDWGVPQSHDADCSASDYISEYLEPMMYSLYATYSMPITLMGYCVGGLLALACAQHNPHWVKRMVLMATPWDFSHHATAKTGTGAYQAATIEAWCRAEPLLPGAYVSWLFYLADPMRCADKYTHFASLDDTSEAYHRFIAVEHWVNDTVPLTRAFARTCLIEWAVHNSTHRLQWKIQGETVRPAEISTPTLIIAPKRDHIVPSASACALAQLLPHVDVMNPDSGHIGMIIGGNRLQTLWQPLQQWLHCH